MIYTFEEVKGWDNFYVIEAGGNIYGLLLNLCMPTADGETAVKYVLDEENNMLC
jgi:hypothetical protein